MYTGQCNVEQLDLEEFLIAGKHLRVTGLMSELDDNEVNITIENKATDNSELLRGKDEKIMFDFEYDCITLLGEAWWPARWLTSSGWDDI